MSDQTVNSNDVDMADALSSNYMLTMLTVRSWSGRKTDRGATSELLASKNAMEGSASVIKSLLYGADKELKETQAAYARIRTWFYANTLPWSTSDIKDQGSRLVGARQAMGFLSEFANLKAEADKVRDKFLTVYDQAVSNAANTLGALYNEDNYPQASEVKQMFGSQLDIFPMHKVNDFDRVAIPGSLAQGLKAIYESKADKQVNSAVIECQERMLTELNRWTTQMNKIVNDDPVRLHKTLITGMDTVVGLARSMGPLNPELAQLADEVEASILKHDLQDLKQNVALARSIASKAIEISERFRDPIPSELAPVTSPALPLGEQQEEIEFDENAVFDLDL